MTVTSPTAVTPPDIAPVIELLGGDTERTGPRTLRGADGTLFFVQHASRPGRQCRFRLGGAPWAELSRQSSTGKAAVILWSEPNRLAYVLPMTELTDAVARRGGNGQVRELTIDTAMHHVIDLDWPVREFRRLLPGG